jgi:hypothetical protein
MILQGGQRFQGPALPTGIVEPSYSAGHAAALAQPAVNIFLMETLAASIGHSTDLV